VADGDFHDPFGPGPHFSKQDLLKVAIRYNAIWTARMDDEELLYSHAIFHATELEAEGLFARYPSPPILEGVEDLVCWVPTDLGRQSVQL
jgi:hypothetical protein